MTTPSEFSSRAAARALVVLAVAGSIAGCGRETPHEITRVVERDDAGVPAPEATLEQRFRPRGDVSGDPHARLSMPFDAAPRGPAFTFTTPDGWRELGPAPMREMAWQIEGAPDLQCTFSVLSGAGGGLGANVDRWRQQMSLPPEGDAGLAALPRHPMLRGQAVRVELAGTYTGMGGTALPGAKLVGLVLEQAERTAFLKLVGPAASVDAATPALLALAASLAPAPSSAAPAGASADGPSGAPDATPAPFTWRAPAEWKRQGARTLRLATYVPKDAGGTEVAVFVLPGRAGGARANVDRWREQMGLTTPLTDAEYGALRRATILGGAAVFLAVDGRYQGMSGAPGSEPIDPARVLGVAVERQKDMVFVKMTGPADEVRREEARFYQFCESFRE